MKRILTVAVTLLAITTLVACGNKKKLSKQERNDLEDTYTQLKRDLPEADITKDGGKVTVVLSEAVLFSVNSAQINTSYLPTFGKMATVLNKYPRTNVLISGFTDATGSDDLNLKLSKERAEAAKDYLVSQNVSSPRIYTWGMGKKNPIATNSSEEGRSKNRRVQFVILYNYNAATDMEMQN